jgi:hypothetical protein
MVARLVAGVDGQHAVTEVEQAAGHHGADEPGRTRHEDT